MMAGYTDAPRPQCEPSCPTPDTMRTLIDETLGIQKELLCAMDDTSMALFGGPCTKPEGKIPELDSMFSSLALVRYQAKLAMGAFMEMRGKML